MYEMIIAEDDPIISESLMKRFNWEELGFHVAAVVSDGKQAVELLSKSPIDVVLSDIVMYELSGLDVARYIHEHKLPTRMVLLSGYQDFEYARQAIRCGVYAYLLKPIDPEELNSVFSLLRSELSGASSAPAPNSPDDDVLTVKQYLEAHLSENPSVAELANTVHLSARHLSRKFLMAEGRSIGKYTLDLQMRMAMSLIRDGCTDIASVCQRIGFSDEKYFRRVFNSYFGYSVSKVPPKADPAEDA